MDSETGMTLFDIINLMVTNILAAVNDFLVSLFGMFSI